jgi:hypothetical protein
MPRREPFGSYVMDALRLALDNGRFRIAVTVGGRPGQRRCGWRRGCLAPGLPAGRAPALRPRRSPWPPARGPGGPRCPRRPHRPRPRSPPHRAAGSAAVCAMACSRTTMPAGADKQSATMVCRRHAVTFHDVADAGQKGRDKTPSGRGLRPRGDLGGRPAGHRRGLGVSGAAPRSPRTRAGGPGTRRFTRCCQADRLCCNLISQVNAAPPGPRGL